MFRAEWNCPGSTILNAVLQGGYARAATQLTVVAPVWAVRSSTKAACRPACVLDRQTGQGGTASVGLATAAAWARMAVEQRRRVWRHTGAAYGGAGSSGDLNGGGGGGGGFVSAATAERQARTGPGRRPRRARWCRRLLRQSGGVTRAAPAGGGGGGSASAEPRGGFGIGGVGGIGGSGGGGVGGGAARQWWWRRLGSAVSGGGGEAGGTVAARFYSGQGGFGGGYDPSGMTGGAGGRCDLQSRGTVFCSMSRRPAIRRAAAAITPVTRLRPGPRRRRLQPQRQRHDRFFDAGRKFPVGQQRARTMPVLRTHGSARVRQQDPDGTASARR